MKQNDNRLFSLDILRGLDMLLLTVLVSLICAFGKSLGAGPGLYRQFDHGWSGFTIEDIIMPLFVFMSGAAVPLALPKRMENGRAGIGYWKHVAGRVVLLWVLGMVVAGRLLSLDVMRFEPFNNTLQSIAVGYLATALAFAFCSRRTRVILPIVLAAVYGVLLHLWGDYSRTGNLAYVVDRHILPWLVPEGSRALVTVSPLPPDRLTGPDYTWYLTSLMFAAMGLCGSCCTEFLRGNASGNRKSVVLVAVGLAALAAGELLELLGVPCIKPIFSVSFTAQAMGWCILAYGILYYVTDVRKIRFGWGLVTLYGQYALAAYVATHVFRGAIKSVQETVMPGLVHLLGADFRFLPVMEALVSATVLTAVLWAWKRIKLARRLERQRVTTNQGDKT